MVNYWLEVCSRSRNNPLGLVALCVLLLFVAMALWAPFLASSKPLCVVWDDQYYFPLFRYLFCTTFFTKKIDIFFNVFGMLVLFQGIALLFNRGLQRVVSWFLYALALFIFIYFGFYHVSDPAISIEKNHEKQRALLMSKKAPSWDFELQFMTPYAKLNLVVGELVKMAQAKSLTSALHTETVPPYSLLGIDLANEKKQKEINPDVCRFIEERRHWLEKEVKNVSFIFFPPVRPFHWEDDVGGSQSMNLRLSFWQASRLSRKDLIAALIFGSRISLLVGFLSCSLSLLIALPLGLASGFYGGKRDICICRFVEVWESMPAFFMLLLIVTVLGTKSLLLIIAIIALFGWTGIFRFVRAEVLRQREFVYVEACRSIGLADGQILARHILPNALVAVIALLPFDIMAAITREAAISFLGLGEEISCSWGVLMDEGRSAFPAESVLLWPPAFMLSLLLISIALLGDALQKAMDT